MVAAYLRQRFRLRIFLPVAVFIGAAVLPAHGQWTAFVFDCGFALLLLVQFRTWDDLADRSRDAVMHPQRVLVREADIAPVVAFVGALAVLNICLSVWRDSSGVAVSSLAALNAVLGIWYLARSSRRSTAGEHLLLAKYPAMVVIVAGGRLFDAPVPTLSAAILLYLVVGAYEAWHDPASPLARLVGGHS